MSSIAPFKDYKIMQSKVSATSSRISDKMAAPIAIGTRGTVGSLVRREIEYFSRFDLQPRASSFQKGQIVDLGCSRSGHSWHGFWFVIMNWKRKSRRGSSSRFLPRICSASAVVDRDQFGGMPGFGYRILKSEVNSLHV